MALQARSKVNLEIKLSASLEAAASHLTWFLGMEGGEGKGKYPDIFKRYELNLTDGSWVEDCAPDATNTSESIEYCIVRKLQALDALCLNPHLLTATRRKAMRAALNVLSEQQENIPGLSVRRDPMPQQGGEGKRNDAEAFVFEEGKVGSGRKVLSPTVHATAMATIARCEQALGFQEKWSTISQWFVAANQAVAQVAPKFDKITHHMLGIVWEALSFVATQLPHERHEQVREADKVVAIVEKAMYKHFSKGDKKSVWSYSGAAAVALRANSTSLEGSVKRRLRKLAGAHSKRFRDNIMPGMNVSQLCTCGPVIGLAPLATVLQDTRLAMLVLELVNKDIDLFQVPQSFASDEIAGLGWFAKAPEPARLRGAFGRHPQHLAMEARTQGMRVDDTGVCLAAVGAALRMVQGMPGIEVDETTGALAVDTPAPSLAETSSEVSNEEEL